MSPPLHTRARAGASVRPHGARRRRALRSLCLRFALVAALLLSTAAGVLADEAAEAEGTAAAADAAPSTTSEEDLALIACAERVASIVQKRYEAVKDLQASFAQETRAVSLGAGPMAGAQTVTGRVAFAKPGRMRWSYEEPAPSLMVSDGSSLWLYDPVAREASHLPVDRGYLSGAALQFLMGEGDLLDTFTVVTEKCDADSSEPVDLDLLPRQPASYERMALRANPETGLIEATTIVDLFGNETSIRFSDIRTDAGVDPSLFDWSPPEDVTVVDLMAPP